MDLTLPTPSGGAFNLTARVVILREGRVLMVKDLQERYYYPVGGRVQFGETAAQAAEREALEETGAALEAERLLFVHENFFWNCHEFCLFYLMKPGAAPVRAVTDDGEALEWLPVDRLGEYDIFPRFFPAELPRLTEQVKHFVTKE
ncbi:MAG: NUDIX domain-containing protein [Oscillospiraceae bacterium]|jgi:ADP-ribose pyrophosphatase YjhB (NUDIX family)|nr:NUDIX domain-containing protein [Oscillospiraceae bacterium]